MILVYIQARTRNVGTAPYPKKGRRRHSIVLHIFSRLQTITSRSDARIVTSHLSKIQEGRAELGLGEVSELARCRPCVMSAVNVVTSMPLASNGPLSGMHIERGLLKRRTAMRYLETSHIGSLLVSVCGSHTEAIRPSGREWHLQRVA